MRVSRKTHAPLTFPGTLSTAGQVDQSSGLAISFGNRKELAHFSQRRRDGCSGYKPVPIRKHPAHKTLPAREMRCDGGHIPLLPITGRIAGGT
jgi:hypothetical protein